MAERNCPAAEVNRVAHEEMRVILAGFKGYVKRQGVSMIEVAALRMRMEEWLVKHILTIDLQLRDCK
jgi:hemerythrin